MLRILDLGREGAGNQCAHFFERSDGAARQHLHSNVSERCCLNGSCNDAPATGLRRKLVQQGILGPSTDDVNFGEMTPGQSLQSVQNKAVLQRQALQHHASHFRWVLGYGLVRGSAKVRDGRKHAFGMKERGMIGIHQAAEMRARLRHLHELRVSVVLPRKLPIAPATLEKPEAHDVLQEAEGAAHATFVGEVQMLGVAVKGLATRRKFTAPVFSRTTYFTDPRYAAPERFLGVMGMPMNAAGEIEAENLTLACRNAVLNMMELLQERGFSRQQAYVICSVAVDLRISNVVDVPNYVVSALLPEAIFDGD